MKQLIPDILLVPSHESGQQGKDHHYHEKELGRETSDIERGEGDKEVEYRNMNAQCVLTESTTPVTRKAGMSRAYSLLNICVSESGEVHIVYS